MKIISPDPAMKDLKVKIEESKLVFPSQQTQKRSFFLSDVDHFLCYNIQTAYFFKANPDYPPELVSQRLKMAVEKVLVPYDFMAGRLKWNHQSGRLEIDCNSQGAGFVFASSEFTLEELGDLLSPNPAFQQLAVDKLPGLDDDKQPLCVFQVTSFKCGGFAFGMSNDHVLLDGLAAKMFRENLASQAFDDDRPLPFVPINDRRLLPIRLPPHVPLPQPSPPPPPPDDQNIENVDFKVVKLSSSDINLLKAKAAADNIDSGKISTFNVVAALLWRCRALSSPCINDNKDSTIVTVLDVRSRVKPPLPPEYCGNAVGVTYASAKCEEIEKWAFSELVEMVGEGINRANEEYGVESGGVTIDWWEIKRRVLCGEDVLLTPWSGLGFDRVVFPWGKSVHFGPLVDPLQMCFVILHGDADADGLGVNVLCVQPAQLMDRILFHLHHFFQLM
ncbi:hypothetical protein ACP275_11G001900 [Erythranthe tilingii]